MNRTICPHRVSFIAWAAPILVGATAFAENADVALWDRVLAQLPERAEYVDLGDMRVPVALARAWRDQLADAPREEPQPDSASQSDVNKWTGGNVFYSFNANVSAAHRTAFRDATAEWAMFAALSFTEGTGTGNYIMVNDGGAGLSGGNSLLGMAGGAQDLNIGSSSWNRGTLDHEIGHALGLIHEHQRNDRDDYVTILTANIVSGQESQFTKIPTSTYNGAYDFLSVMHYARNAFSTDPATLNTIQPKPAYTQYLNVMGNEPDRVLSRPDRLGMAAMYGTGPALSAVVTNTKDSGVGSLRAAIYFALDFASDHPGSSTTVTFNIPMSDPGFAGGVFTIKPTAQLPAPGPGTIIDATTQTTFTGNTNTSGPEVVLNGALVQPPDTYAVGLRLSEANCTVSGLVINSFSLQGVLITGPGATGNTISGCYIGTNATGTAAATNTFAGVQIEAGATASHIGGQTVAARNVISGQTYQGILIKDAGTNGNFVEGNYVGLNAAGAAALANGFAGVEIFNGPQNNTVGGTTNAARNIISGNTAQGVAIHAANANTVAGNTIGLNAAGTGGTPNGFAGVEVWEAAKGNVIGGTTAGAGNALSGNAAQGVSLHDAGTTGNVIAGNFIGLNVGGTAAVANQFAGVAVYGGAQANTIGGTVAAARNIISGNLNEGFYFADTGTSGNAALGNYVGLNPGGTLAVPNAFSGGGIFNGATGNTIGGTVTGAANVISGNTSQGVLIANTGTNNNLVVGNLIGVNATGIVAIQNGYSGIQIADGAKSNMIGGTGAASRNIISGNHNQGVVLSSAGTNGNVVTGNYIGTNAAGTAALANGFAGVEIFGGAASNIVGGSAPGAGNVISGNTIQGVFINSGSTANVVAGNLIGLNATGLAAIPNVIRGIDLYGASANIIGGPGGGRNFISGNSDYGIVIDNTGTTANLIQGNTIGLNVNGTAVANTGGGIEFFGGAQGNTIGGTTPGAANLISGQTLSGIDVFDTATTGNTISGNSIFGNGRLGINLVGGTENASNVTANDNGDGDVGPNNLQNYPVLASAVLGIGTTVTGTLVSTPGTTFRVEFFSSATADASGFGEGQTFIGATNVTTDGTGNGPINIVLSEAIPAGQRITATATSPTGDTSEFSQNITVTTTDTDSDGLPNAYETANGLSTSVNDAALDADGDGMSNLAEFRAGTDPHNAGSVLRLLPPTLVGGNMAINLPSLAGHTYRIEYADDLAVANHWRLFADQILGTGSTISIPDPGAASVQRRFYRVLTLP